MEEKLEKIKLVEYANGLALYALSEYEPDLDNVRAASSGSVRWTVETAARIEQSINRLMRAFFGSAKVDNVNFTNRPEPVLGITARQPGGPRIIMGKAGCVDHDAGRRAAAVC